ncbi:MAG: response regulator [Pirellulales bacterium]
MPKKVLLCDDEIHILRAAEIKISRAGYDVSIAHDGEEAWELMAQERPDVLVTDLHMPRCDGLELTARIRGHETLKDVPIIVLTAKGFEMPRQELMDKWHIVAILSKPFSPRELVGLIDKTLSGACTTTV